MVFPFPTRMQVRAFRLRNIKQATLGAWKNAVYPLGLRVQWNPSGPVSAGRTIEDRETRKAENEGRPRQETTPEDGGLELSKEATGCSSSSVLLRLPMVEKRIRRLLYAWRKLAIKGKRLRYIRDMLPQKVRVIVVLTFRSRLSLALADYDPVRSGMGNLWLPGIEAKMYCTVVFSTCRNQTVLERRVSML